MQSRNISMVGFLNNLNDLYLRVFPGFSASPIPKVSVALPELVQERGRGPHRGDFQARSRLRFQGRLRHGQKSQSFRPR